MALRIQKTLLEGLRQHGEESYPHECCGALVGDFDAAGNRMVRSVIRCGNMRTDSPQKRYQISPAELVRVQREARLAGREIVGFYHSHPDHPAQWSSTDLAEAYWSGCSYVITSVEERKAVDTNSFLLTGNEETKRFEDEAIEVY
ncbi:MAG: M67 family metallopeptidase [Candidatus Korobacteraceae bacterium]|jgi:proteasome lid subunit RPN8/RPN11